MIRYRHTQIGSTTNIASVSGAVILFILMVWIHVNAALYVVAAITILMLLLFSSLTIEISEESFVFWFGVGVIRKRIALSDIVDCRVVRNPWYYGWGIHWTPRGWLYNVSGRLAVEIDLVGGKRLRVGSDQPEALCTVMNLTPADGRSR